MKCLCFPSGAATKTLMYNTDLKCFECKGRGLIKYVLVKKCQHVLCIFCFSEEKHQCSTPLSSL